MAKAHFSAGDRVKIKAIPFSGHTGIVVGPAKQFGRRVWAVELDQPKSGSGLIKVPGRALVRVDADDEHRHRS